MPIAIILCGLAGAMLLALGNERGRRAMLGHVGTCSTRRRARCGGFALLGVFLCLLVRTENILSFALIAWVLACGPALLVAALACTLLERHRSRISSFSGEKDARLLIRSRTSRRTEKKLLNGSKIFRFFFQ